MQGYQRLLKNLQKNKVEFVIIGGFAAVVHGSTILTQDLDLCISFDKANLVNLFEAIKDIHPEFRLIGQKHLLITDEKQILNLKNLYIKTDLGCVDFLSEVSGVGNFREVLKLSIEILLFDMRCNVLSIDALIRSKKFMARKKDKEVIMQLIAAKARNS